MSKWGARLNGGPALTRKIKELEQALGQDAVVKVLSEAGIPIENAARALAPWAHIKRAIVRRPFRNQIPNSPAAFVAIDFRYAPDAYWAEFGTGPRYHKKTGKYVGALAAQPFWRPAVRSNANAVRRNIRKGIEKLIAERLNRA